MVVGEPFDIDAGDRQLTNMTIQRIRRTKDATNEGGLIFEADLQEYATLQTTLSKNAPALNQLREGDPAYTQAVATVNAGQVNATTTTTSVESLIGDLFG